MRGWRAWQVAALVGGPVAKFSAGSTQPAQPASYDGSNLRRFLTLIMTSLPLLAWLASLAGFQVAGPVTVSRLVVAQEVILRVPVIRPRLARPLRWEEKKGPKCIGADMVVAAALSDERSIDFLLRDRSRIRAKMDADCPTLDFYGSFYIEPKDHRICAHREEIRSRIGGSCRIERFRRLVPKLP